MQSEFRRPGIEAFSFLPLVAGIILIGAFAVSASASQPPSGELALFLLLPLWAVLLIGALLVIMVASRKELQEAVIVPRFKRGTLQPQLVENLVHEFTRAGLELMLEPRVELEATAPRFDLLAFVNGTWYPIEVKARAIAPSDIASAKLRAGELEATLSGRAKPLLFSSEPISRLVQSIASETGALVVGERNVEVLFRVLLSSVEAPGRGERVPGVLRPKEPGTM